MTHDEEQQMQQMVYELTRNLHRVAVALENMEESIERVLFAEWERDQQRREKTIEG